MDEQKTYELIHRMSDSVLRDYFAAAAMQGLVEKILLDNHVEEIFMRHNPPSELPGFLAMLSFQVADAMLAERERRPS